MALSTFLFFQLLQDTYSLLRIWSSEPEMKESMWFSSYLISTVFSGLAEQRLMWCRRGCVDTQAARVSPVGSERKTAACAGAAELGSVWDVVTGYIWRVPEGSCSSFYFYFFLLLILVDFTSLNPIPLLSLSPYICLLPLQPPPIKTKLKNRNKTEKGRNL